MSTPSYDEALDTVIARALQWARAAQQEAMVSDYEVVREHTRGLVAEVDEAIEIIRNVQRSSARWADLDAAGDRESCGHADCADEHGHIDRCVHEHADQGD